MITDATSDWHARAAALHPDGRAWIDGRRVDANDGGTFGKHSPVDARRLGQVARGQAADVDAIGFTGSTRVGRRMLECAGRSVLKRVWNELGGKSAYLVFPDCDDLQRCATTLAGSIWYNQGESCNAPSRLLVHEASAHEFVHRVLAEAPAFRPGDPLDPATRMGALVDEQQLRTVLGYEVHRAQDRLAARKRLNRAATAGGPAP